MLQENIRLGYLGVDAKRAERSGEAGDVRHLHHQRRHDLETATSFQTTMALNF